jgi:hypothetical protein
LQTLDNDNDGSQTPASLTCTRASLVRFSGSDLRPPAK